MARRKVSQPTSRWLLRLFVSAPHRTQSDRFQEDRDPWGSISPRYLSLWHFGNIGFSLRIEKNSKFVLKARHTGAYFCVQIEHRRQHIPDVRIVMALRTTLFALCMALFMGGSSTSSGSDWPGWRGDGTGVSADTNTPTEWSSTQNIAWKVDLPGRGISSPIVFGNQIFVTTAYEVEEAHALHTAIRWGMPIALGCLLVCWWFRWRQGTSFPQSGSGRWGSWIEFSVVLGFFVCVGVLEFIQSSDGPARLRSIVASLPRLWLATGGVAALGLASAILISDPRKTFQRILAIAVGLLVVVFFACVPSDSIVFPRSPWRPLAWGLAVCGLVAGALTRTRYAKWGWAVTGLMPCLVISFLLYVQRTNPNIEEANAEHPERFWLLTGLLGAGVLFVISRQLKSQDSLEGSRREFALRTACGLMMLGLTASHFYLLNFLLPVQGIQRSIVCVDATTGLRIWEKGFQTARHERIHRKNSHATPTPVTDGQAVYAYFGDAGILCTEFDGRQRWLNRSIPYRDKYGAASSPVLGRGLVFLSCIDLENPSIIALDQQTGAVRWTHQMQVEKLVGSYAAPWYGVLQGRQQLVINGARQLLGLDPQTGHVLWMRDHEVGEVIPSPVVSENRIVGGGDRRLVLYGLSDAYQAGNPPEILWESSQGAPFHCSTVCLDQLLYTLTDEGVLTCLTLDQGQVKWRKRLDGTYTSSPTVVGRRMFLVNREGVTTVLDIDQRGEILATNDVEEAVESSLAIANSRVIIRTSSQLICVGADTPGPHPSENRPAKEPNPRNGDLTVSP